jgi:SEC-C motif-containing protein
MTSCPCGLPATYDECCGPLHRGEAKAGTPEQLMRSRYSAYAVQNAPYLLRTWHPSTRPAELPFEPGLRWVRLEITGSDDPGPFGGTGTVEFRAHYTEGGRRGVLHEKSRFVRHDNAWSYLDGDTGSTG